MYKLREATVLSNKRVTRDIFLMKVAGEYVVDEGQFFMIKAKDSFMTLFRPISIFDVDKEGVSFLYHVRGEGTRVLSEIRCGEDVSIHGPYGRGFPKNREKIALVGGGIGIAPLYLAGKRNSSSKLYLGLREDVYSKEEIDSIKGLFKGLNVHFKIGGLITEEIDFKNYDTIFTCGPEPMMKAITKLHKNVYVSLEKHMGCGIGACLSCSCKSKDKMVKVCTDGPVFYSEEVAIL
ncbi:MAG: dihydroorotate dehydrogenase electron transfer subunit [Filifactoraceae bacterium]